MLQPSPVARMEPGKPSACTSQVGAFKNRLIFRALGTIYPVMPGAHVLG